MTMATAKGKGAPRRAGGAAPAKAVKAVKPAKAAKAAKTVKPAKAAKAATPGRGARKFDAALRRQLAQPDGSVEAVVQLRGSRAAGGFAAPEDTESLAKKTLRAVEQATGRKAIAWHVFRHLSSFVVSGPSELIRGFARFDVVRAVLANRQPALAPIAPVRSRAVRRPLARPRVTTTRRKRD
jgi:hypothetical protein